MGSGGETAIGTGNEGAAVVVTVEQSVGSGTVIIVINIVAELVVWNLVAEIVVCNLVVLRRIEVGCGLVITGWDVVVLRRTEIDWAEVMGWDKVIGWNVMILRRTEVGWAEVVGFCKIVILQFAKIGDNGFCKRVILWFAKVGL